MYIQSVHMLILEKRKGILKKNTPSSSLTILETTAVPDKLVLAHAGHHVHNAAFKSLGLSGDNNFPGN